MAYNDIKSTGERVSALKNIKKQIDLCIKNCQLAQQFYGSETGTDTYGDFSYLWEGVNARLIAADASADLAITELTELVGTDGFVFQYEWVIGRRGVVGFQFDESSDSILINATDPLVIDAGVVLQNLDYIVVTGTTSNDGTYVVTTGSTDDTILVVGGAGGIDIDETCTASGAKIKLQRRVV